MVELLGKNAQKCVGFTTVLYRKNVSFLNDIRESCLNADLIIIHTEWDEFKSLDFKKICRNKKVKIYDMRNLYSTKKMTLNGSK